MKHPTSTSLSVPAYATYTLDHTVVNPVQQTFQHAVLLNPAVPSRPQMQFTPSVTYQWDHLPWDEEFHIEHHRENLRKLDDLLAQLAQIAYGD